MAIIIICEWWNERRHACQPAYILQILLGNLINIFFPRLPSWNIYHLLHLFITLLWPQTCVTLWDEGKESFQIQMGSKEMSIVFCSVHSPQEIKNINVGTGMKRMEAGRLISAFILCCPSIFLPQKSFFTDLQRWNFSRCVCQLVYHCDWACCILYNAMQSQTVKKKRLSTFFYWRQYEE